VVIQELSSQSEVSGTVVRAALSRTVPRAGAYLAMGEGDDVLLMLMNHPGTSLASWHQALGRGANLVVVQLAGER